VLVHEDEVVAIGTHRDLLHNDPRYRAVVTRETEDESALREALDHDEAALRSALEEIEESA
jgi:putative ABC transport system ATP-binding protein